MDGCNPVKEMEEAIPIQSLLDNWKPRTPLQEVWWWIRYGIWNWVGYRGEIWRYIVRFWQRGHKGYSTCDVWGLNYHLASVILGSVKELRDNLNGHPCDVKDLKEWEDILEHIIWTFEVVINIYDQDWLYLEPERRNPVEMKKLHEFAKDCSKKHSTNKLLAGMTYHVMTYEECERYERGWALLQKHFLGLWD